MLSRNSSKCKDFNAGKVSPTGRLGIRTESYKDVAQLGTGYGTVQVRNRTVGKVSEKIVKETSGCDQR
jgi:hypothetical protein